MAGDPGEWEGAPPAPLKSVSFQREAGLAMGQSDPDVVALRHDQWWEFESDRDATTADRDGGGGLPHAWCGRPGVRFFGERG